MGYEDRRRYSRLDYMLCAVTNDRWVVVFAPTMDDALEHLRAHGFWPGPDDEAAAIAAGRWLKIADPTYVAVLAPLVRGEPPPYESESWLAVVSRPPLPQLG
jgi:hypothetical protein